MREIQWFTNSPDAGDPACICSWCDGQIEGGDVPVRAFDGDSEARFHQNCHAVPMAILTGQIPHPAIPTLYRPPLGLPLNWQDETSGTLPAAVKAFIDYQVGVWPEPSQVQLWLVCEYIRHHINAPCWDVKSTPDEDGFGPEVAALREKAETLESCEDIAGYIRQALQIGIDPL